ncbi:MAG: PDZ domain-containing protein, partial [Planctomycetes bacterium]|nr:PDZ domain-containing protein [Planctomycetota bacterium]
MTRDKLGHALFALAVCLLLTSGQTSPTSAVVQEKKDAPKSTPSTGTQERQEPATTDSAPVGAEEVTPTEPPKEEQPATEEADPPGETETPVAEAPAARQPEPRSSIKPLLPDEWVGALKWRSIGPANMSGRITEIAVYEKDPWVFWIASASGGLLKTINNGVTFEHQFDHESTVSIGSVAVAQTDKNIVWVGTGEANPRNSVSWGDGVYKSVDGGKTFKNMGLKKSFQIGRVAIHPIDPNIVYVGALGRLWGPNEERGLYKTTDAGETWEKMLYIDDKTGVVDVQINPDDPDTLIVATYERMRDGFDSNDPATKQGEGSALYKTTNGGKTWMKLTEGLPAGKLGRIGIDYYRKDPNTVYVVLESELVGKQPEDAAYMGITGEDADVGARLTDITKDGPAEKADLKKGDIVIAVGGKTVHSYRDLTSEIRKHMAGDKTEIEVSRDRKSVLAEVTFNKAPDRQEDNGDSNRRRRRRSPFDIGLGGQRENVQEQQGPDGHKYGGVYKSTDGGDSWTRINSVNPRPMYYSQIRVDPRDDKHIYVLGTQLYRSKDGGETFTSDGGRGIHVDHHALWIDPKDGRHMIVGNDGGIHVTYDRMEKWDTLSHVAIGQFYHVTVDSRRNYRVYGGLQDNGSWGGPSRSRHGSGPINQDWFRIGGGDGFICLTDREDPDLVYFESQNGGMGRLNLRTGERGFIRPRAPRGGRGQPGARGESVSGGPSGRARAQSGGRGGAAAGGRAGARRGSGRGSGSAGDSAGTGPPGEREQAGPRGERRQRYRFNWKTPFLLSNHNSRIHYSAGNHVFRSLD